jgi:hypothetical protein
MSSATEFWLNTHQLSAAYSREGLTPDERLQNIIDQFREMPPIAQRELLDDIGRLVAHLPDVYTLAVTVANDRASPAKAKAAAS